MSGGNMERPFMSLLSSEYYMSNGKFYCGNIGNRRIVHYEYFYDTIYSSFLTIGNKL